MRVELTSFMNRSNPQSVLIGKPVPDQAGKVYALPGGQDPAALAVAFGLGWLVAAGTARRRPALLLRSE